MSDQKDDGGPAFPEIKLQPSGWADVSGGMTLRDFFAGQALVGIAGPHSADGFTLSPSDSAAWAYEVADAMLAERAKR